MIACYDLEDNLITVFDNYEECAKWFNTTSNVIECYLCKNRKGRVDKKRDIKTHKWYRLMKLEA